MKKLSFKLIREFMIKKLDNLQNLYTFSNRLSQVFSVKMNENNKTNS